MNKLHIRIVTAFILLVMLPIFLSGLFVIYKTRSIQIRQSIKSQEQMVQRVKSEFLNYTKKYETSLLQLIRVRGLLELNTLDRVQVIEEMLAFGNAVRLERE